MFIDARTLSNDQHIDSDLCIIGAGAAGIAIAREFAGRKIRITLLESGGMAPDGATQALANGDNIGVPYFPLIGTRLRMFGGTTNHWSGFTRPMDPIDFEARDEIPHSGWPFSYDVMSSFYGRAHAVLQLDPRGYDVAAFQTKEATALPLAGNRLLNVMFMHHAIRFGEVYKAEIEKASNITTYLNANVTEIETTQDAGAVTQLRVACIPDRHFTVAAKTFILATGAIENARLLLTSRAVEPKGLGNRHDLVGRFFMEHPHFESGLFLPRAKLLPLPLYDAHWSSKGIPFASFTLSKQTLRDEKLPNINFALTPLTLGGGKSKTYINREVDDAAPPAETLKELANLTAGREDLSAPVKFYSIYNRIEQVPNPDSRVVLSDKKDSLGMPVANLDWRLTNLERRAVRRGQQILAEELGRAGLGHVRMDLTPDDATWPKPPPGGFHHMGTTRMHVDAKRGVVDANARVHGVSNLYIAGSSVFPTCGYANPTLTLVALALRLADHVKKEMG